MIYQDYLGPEPIEHPQAGKVNAFIDTLDENNKIILLGCANGYSNRQVAEWTGIPESHIRVYYSRLKKKLEEQLLSELSGKEPV
jgi:FixJ family two-component response regulator